VKLPIEFLKTFAAVADSGSFTRAADIVYRTQSAVSMQMKRLEEIIGQSLFRKEGRSVRLTPAGETLLEHARRILAAHNEAVATFSSPEMIGRIRFGCGENYASRFLPALLSGFRRAYPRIRVDIQSAPGQNLYDKLQQEKLDLCLLEDIVDGGQIVHREPVKWATSAKGAAHEEKPLPLAVYHRGCHYRKWAIEALNKMGKEYWIAFVSPSISSIMAAVREGLAVAPIGASMLNDSLRVLGPESGFPNLPVSEVRLLRSEVADTELVDCFANYVAKSFQELEIMPWSL
jgi:DNA-binding transcriptional LysR family regulator